MRMMRGLGGALLWIVGCLVGLVAVLLCVTIILAPVGIMLFRVARRFIDKAILLMLPRPVAHPVQSLGRGSKRTRRKAEDAMPSVDVDTKKLGKRARKKSKKAVKKGREKVGV